MAKIKYSDIGEMNTRILAQKLIETQNSDGDISESWEDLYSCWVNIEPVKSARDFRFNQTVSVNSFQLQQRFEPAHEVSKNIRYVDGQNIYVTDQFEVFTYGRKRYWRVIISLQK